MSKKVLFLTKNGFRAFPLKVTMKPFLIYNNRFFRCDDELFAQSSQAPDSILCYQIDSSQPFGHGKFLDPDMTKVFIDSAKTAEKKATRLSDFSINKAIPVVIVIVVVISVIYSLMR